MAQKIFEIASQQNLQAEIDARRAAVNDVLAKVNKDFVTEVGVNGSENGVNVTVDILNPVTNTSETYTHPLPVANTSVAGIMPKEAYAQILQNSADIQALKSLPGGGKYIGVAFNTKADLDAYEIPGTVVTNDFTFIDNDETHNGSCTMYIFNGTEFKFARVVEELPIPIATGERAGLVKSSEDAGKVFVEVDGSMSLNGYDNLVATDANLANDIATKVTANESITAGTGTKITYDAKGLVTGSEGLVEGDIPTLSQAKINGLESALAAKAEQSALTALQNNLTASIDGLQGSKADKTALEALEDIVDTKAAQSDVADLSNILLTKADQSALDDLEEVVNGKVTANEEIVAGTATKVTYDAKGLVTGGANLEASDIPDIEISQVTGLQSVLDTKADKTALEDLETVVGTKAAIADLDALEDIVDTKAAQTAVDALEATVATKVTANESITAGTGTKITYDAKGLVTGSAALDVSDIPELPISKVVELQAGLDNKATKAELQAVITLLDPAVATHKYSKEIIFKTAEAESLTQLPALTQESIGHGHVELAILEIDNDGSAGTVDVKINVDGTVYLTSFEVKEEARKSYYALYNNPGAFITGKNNEYLFDELESLMIDNSRVDLAYPSAHIDFGASFSMEVTCSGGAKFTGYNFNITKKTTELPSVDQPVEQ